MGWKQRRIGIGESYERFRDGVELLRLRAPNPEDIALLTRTTADRRYRILLLTPAAVETCGDVLSELWVASDAPELLDWDIVEGDADIRERLGLARPQFGKRAPSPVAAIGGGGNIFA
jgi:hypothetical protein